MLVRGLCKDAGLGIVDQWSFNVDDDTALVDEET